MSLRKEVVLKVLVEKREQLGRNVVEPQRVTFPMLQLERASIAGGP